MEVSLSAEKIMNVIKGFDKDGEWLFANWLWKLRGAIEGKRSDFYEVDAQSENLILFRSKLKSPGEGWMEWRVEDNLLIQTAYFAPRGLGGFLYWYLLAPFHAYVFQGLLKSKSNSYETSFLLLCVWNQNPQHRLGRWESQSGLDLFSTSFPREVVEPNQSGRPGLVGSRFTRDLLHSCATAPGLHRTSPLADRI